MENMSLWTVISTMLSVVFLIANVAQLVAYRYEKSLVAKEKEINKGQIKVWQHHASGIVMGLSLLSSGKFSSVEDLKEGMKVAHEQVISLVDSLNEERLLSEDEVEEKQFIEKFKIVGQKEKTI